MRGDLVEGVRRMIEGTKRSVGRWTDSYCYAQARE